MPTYNRDDVISFAIESVLEQTVSDFELLVVGDGCTDKTEQIVKEFQKKDKRIYWFPFLKAPYFGYSNRNKVLEKAKGYYIAFAAHDDLWFPDHLKLFLNFFQKNKDYNIAYTRPLWIHPSGVLISSSFNTNDENVKNIFLLKHNEIPADSVIHKRVIAKKVNLYNDKLQKDGDWDLWKRIILKDKKRRIGFITIPTTIHFRANWRKKGNFWNSTLEAMYRKIKQSSSLKRLLSVKKENKPLQQTVWEKYLKDPIWIGRLRENLINALDSLSHDYVITKAENYKLNSDMKRIASTKGYKLLEYLRKIVKKTGRVGK